MLFRILLFVLCFVLDLAASVCMTYEQKGLEILLVPTAWRAEAEAGTKHTPLNVSGSSSRIR